MGKKIFTISSNAQDWIKYLGNVAEKTQIEVDRNIPKISRATKQNVKSHLVHGAGIEQGIYRKSFRINNFAESKWHVGFQVFARKPHYRLTHLLEGVSKKRGHRTVLFRWGKGKRTKWGNVGMNWVLTTKNKKHPLGYTRAIKHIEPGQNFAEMKVVEMYETTIKNNMERMKK